MSNKDMKKLTKKRLKDFQDKIDISFGSIQRFINECDCFDDDTRCSMITLCMKCNDKLNSISENEYEINRIFQNMNRKINKG